MKKKIGLIVLCLMMVFSLVPMSAMAGELGTVSDDTASEEVILEEAADLSAEEAAMEEVFDESAEAELADTVSEEIEIAAEEEPAVSLEEAGGIEASGISCLQASNPWIRLSRTKIYTSESITFYYGADNTNGNYDIYIYKDGCYYVSSSVYSSDFTYTFDQPGNYSVYVRCYSSWGSVDTEYKTFTVEKKSILYIGWKKIANSWYYYGSNGKCLTGWQKIANYWFYFGNNGARRIGWQKVSGRWYYLGNNGVMQLGWQQIAGKMYCLGKNGVMKTGWQKISGRWYYFGKNGVRRTGWVKVSGKWFYMDNNGIMKTGWLRISGKYYYLGSDGVMRTGWVKISGRWYHFNSKGQRI